MVLAVIIYLPILIFGTHLVRTLAFNRHEAITFESSSVTALVALLLIWQYGPSERRLLLCGILLVMFIANAFTQWHFYMKLQDRIDETFSKRTDYLENYLEENNKSVIGSLKTMASVAIMPSFSRFIEESKYFNNPGNLIGLIKSIMKRQRFQKKKYLMRECFAEILNLIGPSKPEIDDMMSDDKDVVPGTIRANDLALDKKEEIAGLISFDVLGFGALAVMFSVLLNTALNGTDSVTINMSPVTKAFLMFISALLFTALSHLLRHYGFARYESFFYELSFTTLVIASFRVLVLIIGGHPVLGRHLLTLAGSVLVFILLSFINKYLDRKLHKKAKEALENVIDRLSFDNETDRVKRRILRDLDTISEWSIVPFNGRRALDELPDDTLPVNRLAEFNAINRRKRVMPYLTADLIRKVAPEWDGLISEGQFKLDGTGARIVSDVVGAAAFIALFIFIGLGWI